MARCLSWTTYPLIAMLSVATLWFLLRCGAALSWAPYVAAAVAGIAVFAAEGWLPYRAAWQPTSSDVLQDGAFLVLAQVAVPLGLGWITLWLLQALLADYRISLGLWPADYPIWVQVFLKLVIGDFLRYWLHRWSHEWSPLWRWHALHHQPRKLYGWNVFRFHPADKAFQFVFDSVPFLVLGMGRESFAYYFVIYATSGFLQHANCDLRLGWFNYLLSGPEVHRWHHAADLTDANHNYAHTLVLWDVLFGTYHRPSREVGALGLNDPGYPSSFVGQLAAPFHRPVVETSNGDF
ncbi:MAG: sterol desaturase family protein [Proteobacteria bacterium]|nr:sterol desaturase family protein [Pseudomonadota bacterium]